MSAPHGRPKGGSLPLGGTAHSAKGAPFCAPHGRPKGGSLPLGGTALAALLVALHLASPALAAGQARRHIESGSEATVLSKPEVGQSKTANPSHVVNEGGVERPLWIDTSRVVEFPQAGGAGQAAIRPAEPGEVSESNRTSKAEGRSDDATTTSAGDAGSSADPSGNATAAAAPGGAAAVSPVFVDASGRPRALPGGVIVSLKQGLRESQAREQLQAAGLTPVRQIGERMWLVESPVGIASLELANRLHATGRFEFVQPNWWQPRSTK